MLEMGWEWGGPHEHIEDSVHVGRCLLGIVHILHAHSWMSPGKGWECGEGRGSHKSFRESLLECEIPQGGASQKPHF